MLKLNFTYVTSGSIQSEEEAAPEDGLTMADATWEISRLEQLVVVD